MDAVAEGTVTLTHEASGGAYDGVRSDMTVTIKETDAPNVTVSPTTLKIREGTSEQYRVALTSEPSDDVTVTMEKTLGRHRPDGGQHQPDVHALELEHGADDHGHRDAGPRRRRRRAGGADAFGEGRGLCRRDRLFSHRHDRRTDGPDALCPRRARCKRAEA